MNSHVSFDKLAAKLAGSGAVKSQMFGCPCLKTGSKAFVCLYKDDLVVKLPKPEAEIALRLPGVKVFEPRDGRPMNGWYRVPPSHRDHWLGLAEAGMYYVTELVSNDKK